MWEFPPHRAAQRDSVTFQLSTTLLYFQLVVDLECTEVVRRLILLSWGLGLRGYGQEQGLDVHPTNDNFSN